ncbi:MAG: multidrug efflux SMR transporter [Rikenellaceae bacterium]|nr:multidrug efflux SMR transporter [Rikenellaceae bacterium]
MGWIYLILGGLFEIGWPLGLKLAQTMPYRILWIVFSAISMAISGWFLYTAQKTIPIGTAYVVWTGIGAVGTLILGILLFHDSASVWRLLSASLIVLGIIGLKVLS